jgi:hypothetical protein
MMSVSRKFFRGQQSSAHACIMSLSDDFSARMSRSRILEIKRSYVAEEQHQQRVKSL